MFKKPILITTMAAMVATSVFTGCTGTEQGAGYGALAGAGIGALAGGNTREILGGAAIGAVAGALVGTAIDANERDRYRGRAPRGGYPVAEFANSRGFVYSPYRPNRIVDVRGVPRGSYVRCPFTGEIFIRP